MSSHRTETYIVISSIFYSGDSQYQHQRHNSGEPGQRGDLGDQLLTQNLTEPLVQQELHIKKFKAANTGSLRTRTENHCLNCNTIFLKKAYLQNKQNKKVCVGKPLKLLKQVNR